jgi:5-formyltetrahydrofolate cyclo-ligase
MNAKKNELRKRMKENLSKVSLSDLDNWNIALSKNLNKFLNDELVISENEVIGGFAPLLYEPVWFLSLTKKVRMAFPAFKERMFFKISSIEDLEVNADFGVDILGPKESAEKILPKMILVPGLGFSQNGERLGRGKGFYDRYLECFNGVKIGLCFECQMNLQVPVETHDQKMNFIITEKNIYRIRS